MEIAELYDTVKAADILVFSAGEETIFVTMQALLGEGLTRLDAWFAGR